MPYTIFRENIVLLAQNNLLCTMLCMFHWLCHTTYIHDIVKYCVGNILQYLCKQYFTTLCIHKILKYCVYTKCYNITCTQNFTVQCIHNIYSIVYTQYFTVLCTHSILQYCVYTVFYNILYTIFDKIVYFMVYDITNVTYTTTL